MFRNLFELYKYRQLLAALVERHLSSRYRGSVLGFFWSMLNPLCLMLVYTIVFHYYMRNQSIPHYEIFVFCGLLPWLWATSSLAEGTSSIVASGHLVTKSLFPAHLLPTVTVLTNLVNFILSLPLLFLFLWIGGLSFYTTLFLLPVLIFIHAVFLVGFAVALSGLNVYYRDIQHLVGNAITVLFFLNPIVYSSTLIPQKYQWTLVLNPFSLFTISYQDIILRGEVNTTHILLLTLESVVVLTLGYWIFNRNREQFAEAL